MTARPIRLVGMLPRAKAVAESYAQKPLRRGNFTNLVTMPTRIFAVGAALVTVAMLLVFAYVVSDGLDWKRSAKGPYEGLPFTNAIFSQPNQTLKLGGPISLEVYTNLDTPGPVVALRNNRTNIIWARLLAPSAKDNSSGESWTVQTLNLQGAEASEGNFVVHFLCDWSGGGRERGIILIKTNLTFGGLTISW